MLDRPWMRLVLGALLAALLGAMAARVAVSASSAGSGGGAGQSPGAASSGGRDGGAADGAAGEDAADGGGAGSGGSGATATLAGGSGRVTVHVTGEVRRPGVYALPEGARVDDAVRRAGGARASGDRQALNLAATVRDGQQVRVPPRPEAARGGAGAGGPGAGGASPAGGPATPVDLNTASAEELQTLDGVGEATAAKIVQLREQRGGIGGVDDLDEIPGIGAKKLEALRAQLEP